jgi:broad specificity phosphatase PhoE
MLATLGSLATAYSVLQAAETSAPKSPAPVTVLIVRHGEKSAVSGDVPLSAEGKARAAFLATMLQGAALTAVFSSELTFAQETAAPVAEMFNLKPVVIPVRETDRLVAELEKLPGGSVAFVVNHSGQIGNLVEKLGGARPAEEATSTFGRLWVLSRQPGGKATVAELRYGRGDE